MTTQTIITMLAGGMLISIQIFFWTLVGGIPLGALVCAARMSHLKPLSWFARGCISILRGTPLMLQLLVVYFGPYFIFGLSVGQEYRLTAVYIAFILNYSAYFAEIYRSGVESIPRGQYEAADVLGYSKMQTFFKIVLPQVVKRIVPSMTNEVITLIKDTSLAFAIGVAEMFTQAQAIAASDRSMFAFLIAAVFYYVFNLLVAFIMSRVEHSMAYYHE